MEELISIIGNVGFPIAVSAYLLVRIERKLDELTYAISELRSTLMNFSSQKTTKP